MLHGRFAPHQNWLAIVMAWPLLLAAGPGMAQSCPPTLAFVDRFEQGGGAAPTRFRLDSLVLEHPHVIVDYDGGLFSMCHDATFDDYVFSGTTLIEGINPSLAGEIDDLNLNLLGEFNLFGQDDGWSSCFALEDADCESPEDCTPTAGEPIAETELTVQRSGACIDVIDGLYDGVWPDGRASQINLPEAEVDGCFLTETVDVTLTIEVDGESLALPLVDARLAGRFDGEPASRIEDGVISGFLTQSAADEIDVEVDSPFGPITLNLGEDMLPADSESMGGCEPRTHCDGPDARSMLGTECGWRMVFNFSAARL